MPTISVKIEGLDAVINFTKQVSIRMPLEANKLNQKLAKNTEKKARQFLKSRYSGKRTMPPTGKLERSILAYQQKPEEWRVKVGGTPMTPYAMVQEYGKDFPGRRFIPMSGKGKSGEGVSVKDPSSTIHIPAKHFMEDATNDTIQKAENMVNETAKAILK